MMLEMTAHNHIEIDTITSAPKTVQTIVGFSVLDVVTLSDNHYVQVLLF